MFTKHYAQCALHKSKLCTLHSALHPTTLHTAAFPAERHGVFLPSAALSSIHCILLCTIHNPIMPPDDDVEEIHLKRVFFPRPTHQSFPCILCQWPSLSYHRRRSKSKCASGAPRFLRQSVAPGRPLPAGVSSIC